MFAIREEGQCRGKRWPPVGVRYIEKDGDLKVAATAEMATSAPANADPLHRARGRQSGVKPPHSIKRPESVRRCRLRRRKGIFGKGATTPPPGLGTVGVACR